MGRNFPLESSWNGFGGREEKRRERKKKREDKRNKKESGVRSSTLSLKDMAVGFRRSKRQSSSM